MGLDRRESSCLDGYCLKSNIGRVSVYEQGQYEQGEERGDKGFLPEGRGKFATDPRQLGGLFFRRLQETHKTHKYGKAVEVKSPQFYTTGNTSGRKITPAIKARP